jgi:hypothetical protein
MDSQAERWNDDWRTEGYDALDGNKRGGLNSLLSLLLRLLQLMTVCTDSLLCFCVTFLPYRYIEDLSRIKVWWLTLEENQRISLWLATGESSSQRSEWPSCLHCLLKRQGAIFWNNMSKTLSKLSEWRTEGSLKRTILSLLHWETGWMVWYSLRSLLEELTHFILFQFFVACITTYASNLCDPLPYSSFLLYFCYC